MHKPIIYLDNSTAAKPSEKAISAMLPFYTTHWGVPAVPHQKGQELYPWMAEFYKTIYTSLGADKEDHIILTSTGTESVNHVISSVYRDVTVSTGKNHFLTSSLDEAPAIMAMGRLEPFGCSSKMIPPNRDGIITPQALAESITPRTALFSLSWANGLTGVIQPVQELAELCRQRGIRFHLDATHVIGKLFYLLEEIGPDYLTVNGDQIHAPRGSAILYIRRGVQTSPFIFGSSDQGGMRGGSLNVAALAGFACAIREAVDCCDLLCTEGARLRNSLERGILKGFPQAQVCFNSSERLPHCSTILFPGISNEALLFALDRKGVCASIGGGNFQQLALMLSAAGIDSKIAHQAISFSLSRYTTEEEIDRAVDIVVNSAKQLSKLSEKVMQ
jgi:cysteine desulfurase